MNDVIATEFYARDTVTVAIDLLGKKIIHRVDDCTLAGIIVETEAYCSNDPASHAFKGITKRNAPMFGPVGHAYVYFIYGNHYCFNVVAKSKQEPAGAVLIRAIEPCEGIDIMTTLRHGISGYNLTNGPGKLTQALCINSAHNNANLTLPAHLALTHGHDINSQMIVAHSRVGISVATDKLWRFTIEHNKWASQA